MKSLVRPTPTCVDDIRGEAAITRYGFTHLIFFSRLRHGDGSRGHKDTSDKSLSKHRVLLYMMLGRHKAKRTIKSELKRETYFYLDSGTDHASDCSKINLSPSLIASPSSAM